MSKLTSEEKQRIYEEEKAKLGMKEKAKKEEKAKNTKLGCLGIIGLIVIIIIGSWICGIFDNEKEQSGEQSREQAITEIYSITADESVSKYAQVKNVEFRDGSWRVMIQIVYDPEFIMNMEDAFAQAKVWTDTVARKTVKILDKYDVENDVSVWAQLPLEEGKVALLGNTRYSKVQGTYQWKRYER